MHDASHLTPADLAAIQMAAFKQGRPWQADEFQALLSSDHVFLVSRGMGFALGRVIADEVELLTIAVAPKSQGQGVGRLLLDRFETQASERGARYGFLEVAEDNAPARQLYQTSGWTESGRRKGYYARQTGESVDAMVLSKQFPQREPAKK